MILASRMSPLAEILRPHNTRLPFFADGGSPLSALLYVAYEKTFFFSQRVNFHLSLYPTGKEALDALISGKADLATVADIPIVHAALDQKDFVILATIANSRNSVGIIAEQTVKEPQDIRGRKIGFFPGTNSEYFLNEFLVKYGISKADVIMVPLQATEAEEALGKHKVEAIAVFDPYLTGITKILGSHVKAFYAPDIYTFTWNVVASRRLLRNTEALQNIIRALHVAERYAIDHPNEAIEITSRYLRMSSNQTSEIWNTLNLEVNLLQSLVVNLERQAKWAMQSKGGTRITIPDFGYYMDVNAIKAVLPNRVTVIE